MSPTSYQAAPPRITFEAKKVPHAGRSVKYHRRRAIDPAPTGKSRCLSPHENVGRHGIAIGAAQPHLSLQVGNHRIAHVDAI
jgi:hypothetical protein